MSDRLAAFPVVRRLYTGDVPDGPAVPEEDR